MDLSLVKVGDILVSKDNNYYIFVESIDEKNVYGSFANIQHSWTILGKSQWSKTSNHIIFVHDKIKLKNLEERFQPHNTIIYLFTTPIH
jgi:hypothetical protein